VLAFIWPENSHSQSFTLYPPVEIVVSGGCISNQVHVFMVSNIKYNERIMRRPQRIPQYLMQYNTNLDADNVVEVTTGDEIAQYDDDRTQ